jgi:hypothetical protein
VEAARRGRPQSPARESVLGSNSLKLRSRIGWLLRINRLYGANGAWESAASFASAFAGGSHPGAVSPSKISRWETGLVNVPYSAIRRYEELLSLPARSLSSTVDVVSRNMSAQVNRDSAAMPWLSRAEQVTDHGFDSFLDTATSAGLMTAADWDDLSSLIASNPGLRLRRREWEAISSRLLVETVSADGDAWKPRFEAFMRLLSHPDGQQAAIAACAAWARCRDNHAAIEVISLLDTCHHPDAASAVIGQLTSPVKDDVFAGALLACVRKVQEGHFSPEQVHCVAEISMETLSAHTDQQLRTHAAAVLSRLPPDLRSRVSRHLGVLAGDNPRRHDAQAGLAQQDNHLSGLIAARSISLLAHESGHFEDELLPALVNEMIFSSLSETRLYAAFLIRDTPYRQPVADSLIWAMKRVPGTRDNAPLTRLLSALRIVGDAEHRHDVEGFADPGMPLPIQDMAIQALGHMGGKSDPAFWQRTFGWLATRPLAHDSDSEKLMIHAAYSAGMKRHVAELKHASGIEALPGSARTAAKWWLNLPTHMFMSAER